MWFLLAVVALAESDAPDLPFDAVVLVEQGAATCSGAFVDDQGTVATAYHCVAHGGRPRITTYDGRRAVGKVSRVDPALDLALISVPDLAGGLALVVHTDAPALGATVRSIGHPYGGSVPTGYVEGTLRWAVSEGIVSAVGPRALQTTAPLNPGNSGGPIIDEENRLVGVVSRRYAGDGIGFATLAAGVQALLDGAGHSFGPLGGTLSLELGLSAWEGIDIAIGARMEASFRDRVVLRAGASVPIAARWTVARLDNHHVSWSQFEATGGLRQRFFRGTWTSWLEAYGGVSFVQTLVPDPDYVFVNEPSIAPIAGVLIGVAGAGIDGALVWVDGDLQWRLMITLRYPGTFWMF